MNRGYFGIGVEGISKAANLGNLVRSAHAFGAQFFFTLSASLDMDELKVSDTAASALHMPLYTYRGVDDFALPRGCALVAVEFLPDAVDLPSFRHPQQAAYILGPEMGNVSPAVLKRCDHVIKIPMQFCINVGVAGALVMYDRLLSNGKHMPRPVRAGGPESTLDPADFVHHQRRRVRNRMQNVE